MSNPKGNFVEKDLLKFDFINDRVHYLRPLPKGKNELIAKAIGVGKGFTQVLDATAGQGLDTVVLARLGCQVVAVERNAEIFKLLNSAHGEALQNAETQHWSKQIHFIHADSIFYLRQLPLAERPQVIYMDPMYGKLDKKKSALPRKEMRIFRELVGDDLDAEELLRVALAVALARVVVKRPLKGVPLLREPQHRFAGKSVRYDMYLV